MTWLFDVLKAVGMAVGLVKSVSDEVSDPEPELKDPPPPADKSGLVRDLEAIRKRKFGA